MPTLSSALDTYSYALGEHIADMHKVPEGEEHPEKDAGKAEKSAQPVLNSLYGVVRLLGRSRKMLR